MSLFIVYISFFGCQARCVVDLAKKKRDRRSGAALRSQERALLGKKGKEVEMLLMMRIIIIMTRSVG